MGPGLSYNRVTLEQGKGESNDSFLLQVILAQRSKRLCQKRTGVSEGGISVWWLECGINTSSQSRYAWLCLGNFLHCYASKKGPHCHNMLV